MVQSLIDSGREAQRTGAWDEALARFDAALSLHPAGGDARTRCDLLRWIGTVHAERGALDAAWESFESSRRAAEEAGLEEEMESALVSQAGVDLLRGELDRASELFLAARETADQAGRERLVAVVDTNLGIVANIRGDVATALLRYRSSLARYRKLGDELTATRALMNIAMAHVDLEEWDPAESCLDEAAEMARRTGDTVMTGRIELIRAELQVKRRRYQVARESVDRSLHIFHRLRTKSAIAEAYKFYGIIYREEGRPEQSDTHFALSLGLAEASQNRLLQAETQMEWALLHLAEGREQEGVLYLNRALKLFRELKAGREVLDVERRLQRLREVYMPAVMGWSASLAGEKDPHQPGHARRVADHATRLGIEVGLSGWDITWLRTGAFIHDLGNMVLPEDVLAKSEGLSSRERELMKAHTIMGDTMATQLGFPDEVRPIVRSHHEQWAGGGYPDGLVGEEIPLSARIVSVVDVFDALTSPRSFRPAFTRGEALKVMRRDAERMFDPEIFGTFQEMMK